MISAKMYQFFSPTQIKYGFGSTSNITSELSQLGCSRPLVVTDVGVFNAGICQNIVDILASERIDFSIYSDIVEDPNTAIVSKSAEKFKEDKCDSVICVGGGSALCAGKATALSAANSAPLWEYKGVNKYENPPYPCICIPTTAGSGCEVSGALVLTDERNDKILEILGKTIYPEIALLDPMMLKTLPTRPAIFAGIDALTHAIESLWTTEATPLTDSIAIEAAAMIFQNIIRAVYTDDMQAKGNMLFASTMANIACGNAKLGLVHALANTLHGKVPHGMANGIMFYPVFEFNLPICYTKLALLALRLGEKEEDDWSLALCIADRIEQLYDEFDFPRKFASDQLKDSQIPELVKFSIDHPQAKFNIRKSTIEDQINLFRKTI